MFLDLKIIDKSGSSLRLNYHFTGTDLLLLYFTLLILIVIQDFLDRKLLILDTADILHKFPICMEISSLRV